MSEKQDALAVSTPLRITESQPNKLTRLAVFTPTNMTEAMGLAKLLASSDFVPKDFKGKPGNCFLAMQMGAELGVPPLQALQNIAIINGRPSIWGDLALAVVQAHPDYKDHKEFFTGTPFNDDYTAVFQIERKGQTWHETKFSVADSKTAKLWGKRGYNGQDTPWITNPKRMLQMRARGFGLRDKFADALKGMKLAEEVMDMPPDTRQETGVLDVKNEMATLTTSSEPNRGHGNEGMTQAPALSQATGMDQTSKAQEETICGDCHEKNGKHKADCFYAADAKGKCGECNAQGGHLTKCSKYAAWKASLSPQGTAQPTQDKAGTAQESSTTTEPAQQAANRLAVKITKVIKRTKKPLRTIEVLTDAGQVEMSVWHEHFHPILDNLQKVIDDGGKQFGLALIEYSEKEKDRRIWSSLEKIVELDGVPLEGK